MRQKHIWIAALAFILIATSCKKTNTNSWTFEGVTYTTDVVNISNNIVVAYNNGSQSYLSFTFNTMPTSSGAYRVVNTGYPLPGQVNIVFANLTGSSYRSSGLDSINAAVTFNNGKMGISVNNLWMVSYTDSAKISANISQ
jgi:hypothetical protein